MHGAEAERRASPGAHPQVRQAQREAIGSAVADCWILSPRYRAKRSKPRSNSGPLPDSRAEQHGGQQATAQERSIIPAATNCLRIWNVLRRSLPARRSSARAASAAARPGSSATKRPKCSSKKPAEFTSFASSSARSVPARLRHARRCNRRGACAHRAQVDLLRRSDHRLRRQANIVTRCHFIVSARCSCAISASRWR